MANKPDIIRAIFAAYMSNDRKAVEDALADDFRFTSPYDERIDSRPISSVAGRTPNGSSDMTWNESLSTATRRP